MKTRYDPDVNEVVIALREYHDPNTGFVERDDALLISMAYKIYLESYCIRYQRDLEDQPNKLNKSDFALAFEMVFPNALRTEMKISCGGIVKSEVCWLLISGPNSVKFVEV